MIQRDYEGGSRDSEKHGMDVQYPGVDAMSMAAVDHRDPHPHWKVSNGKEVLPKSQTQIAGTPIAPPVIGRGDAMST